MGNRRASAILGYNDKQGRYKNMAKPDKTEQLAQLTSDYLDAVVSLYKDNDQQLANAANEALANVKAEELFKGKVADRLDSVSIITIASILGY